MSCRLLNKVGAKASKLILFLFASTMLLAATALAGSKESDAHGPTLHLNYGQQSDGCPVAEFMYFVPLISPEPVSLAKSPGNSQLAHIISVTRHDSGKSFLVTCEVEFAGQGYQRNIFDHTKNIRRHDRELKAGKTLDRQLASINVEGAGRLRIEVDGEMSSNVPQVNEVRLHFNANGQPSPVNIGLDDIKYVNGKIQHCNALVARVNTLTFSRKPGPPKMEVTVASVKSADAGDGAWQNFLGSIKGKAVNLLIDPLTVERAGHDAMLNFGLALASQAQTFTFPLAKNLKVEP